MVQRRARVRRRTARARVRSARNRPAGKRSLPPRLTARAIGFDFQKTAGYVKYTWRHARVGRRRVRADEPYLNIHPDVVAIHYGQAIYEGAKAHHCADGALRLWNIEATRGACSRGASA